MKLYVGQFWILKIQLRLRALNLPFSYPEGKIISFLQIKLLLKMFVLAFSVKEIFQYKTKLYLPASCSQAKIHVSATLWCLHNVYGKHAYLVALWAIKTNQTEDLMLNILIWILPIQIAQVVTTDIAHTQKEANLKTCRFIVLLYVLLLLALNTSLAHLIFFLYFPITYVSAVWWMQMLSKWP